MLIILFNNGMELVNTNEIFIKYKAVIMIVLAC